MYLTRTIETFFLKASSQFPVMLLTGARQVGKTTLLQHLGKNQRLYVTLDDPLILTLAKNDPALFMQRFPPPVLIDEIQYAPQLLPYIKMEVDQNRRPGMFWLTGSQQFHLMMGVSESLAGRVGIVELLGLSRWERIGQGLLSTPFVPSPEVITQRERLSATMSLQELYHIIWRGSFPAIALDENVDRGLFFSSYTQTYLQRDVRDLAQVGDQTAFLRFLRATAARTARLLNVAELARDADVAPNTAKRWISILQASGVIYLLQPYHSNVTKRLVKSPKIYFTDTGLAAWLTEWSTPDTLEAGAMSGAILETWIMGEALKSWRHSGLDAPFYFYRDKDQKEIDLVIFTDGIVYPLEFKKTASPSVAIARSFSTLEKHGARLGPGAVICLVKRSLPLSAQTWAVPVGLI
ncbi:MAG: ATP-binding protein [Deltaproteobacteria bacterium]|nr:ATP-binding protein [Deltaproteobacteria bacterium]